MAEWVKDRSLSDLAKGLDPAKGADTAYPVADMIRWNSALSKWQIYSGSSWGDLTASYAINITSTFISIEATSPTLNWKKTDAAANEKYWRIITGATDFNIQTVNDAYSVSSQAYQAVRSGNNVVQHSWYNSDVMTMQNSAGGGLFIRGTADAFTGDRYSANSAGAYLIQQKSRHATIGSHTIVQDGDFLGGVIWRGSNGTIYKDAAYILCQVQGTPGAGDDMPAAIRMYTTPDGSSIPLLGLTLDRDGAVSLSRGQAYIGAFNGTHSSWISGNSAYGWIWDVTDGGAGSVPLGLYKYTSGVATAVVRWDNATGQTNFLFDVTVSRSAAGADVVHKLENSDNTNAASHARAMVSVGGESGGDPKINYRIGGGGAGGADWASGTDNSNLNRWKVSAASDLGTNDVLVLDSGGAIINPLLANPIHSDQTLTFVGGGTTTWDTNTGQIASLTLTASTTTLGAPSNLRKATYILHLIQDGTGSRTMAWNAVFKWPLGITPTLTTTANHRDVFSFVCDGTNLYGAQLKDYT